MPDVSITLYDYPKTDAHAAFNAAFRINFIAGGGGGFKLVGTEGEMEIGQTPVTLKRSKLDMIPGDYSMIAYTEATQKKILQEYAAQNLNTRDSALRAGTTTREAPQGYPGGNYDHVANFFQSIREKRPVVEDATFGLRAAGAALLYALYFPKAKTHRLDLREAAGEFTLHWYDPLSGGALQTGSVTTVTGGGEADLGLPPDQSNE